MRDTASNQGLRREYLAKNGPRHRAKTPVDFSETV